MEYRDVLQYYLDQRGMTQAELAAELGASRSTIGNIMQGLSRDPSLVKAYWISKALGVSLDEMMEMRFGDE